MVSSVLDLPDALALIGASDVLVYRRVPGGRFVLTSPGVIGAAATLTIADEPLVQAALRTRLRRVASEDPVVICAGYTARAAVLVALDHDVVVVLGRRDGCLAGVDDEALFDTAASAAVAEANRP